MGGLRVDFFQHGTCAERDDPHLDMFCLCQFSCDLDYALEPVVVRRDQRDIFTAYQLGLRNGLDPGVTDKRHHPDVIDELNVARGAVLSAFTAEANNVNTRLVAANHLINFIACRSKRKGQRPEPSPCRLCRDAGDAKHGIGEASAEEVPRMPLRLNEMFGVASSNGRKNAGGDQRTGDRALRVLPDIERSSWSVLASIAFSRFAASMPDAFRT